MPENKINTQPPQSMREYLGALVWEGRSHFARWLYGKAIRLDPRMHVDVELPATTLHGDDPLVDVLQLSLSGHTGKLRVSDAYVICGIQPGSATLDQIARLGRALREQGWERQRRRVDGSFQHVYVKGSVAERQVQLIVEYDPHMRSVRIESDKTAAA